MENKEWLKFIEEKIETEIRIAWNKGYEEGKKHERENNKDKEKT